MAFVTLAQGTENLANDGGRQQPIQNLQADTFVYYMGRKDAANIAKQLITSNSKKNSNTPVHVLEAVSRKNERHWSSTLEELANGEANDWFDSASPALIMIGEALREKRQVNKSINQVKNLKSSSTEINDSLQNSFILANGRRYA